MMNKKLLSFIAAAMLAAASLCAGEPATFTAASYNLRQSNRTDSVNGNGWGRRLPYVAGLIRFHGFDIFGTQEGFRPQLDSLLTRLPGYAWIGKGRDDGRSAGEHSAIFYDTAVFELLEHGDFWLSEHPDRPGLGWDAVCPRICTWGKFRHKASGKKFMFASLHMDHVGRKARVEGARLVKKTLHNIAADLPAIVTGDFNVDQHSPVYGAMTDDGTMLDSYVVADFRYAPNGTFNSYETDGYTDSRIDHLFVSPGISVLKYGVLTDTYRVPASGEAINPNAAPAELKMSRYKARTPSDHFPVMTVLSF